MFAAINNEIGTYVYTFVSGHPIEFALGFFVYATCRTVLRMKPAGAFAYTLATPVFLAALASVANGSPSLLELPAATGLGALVSNLADSNRKEGLEKITQNAVQSN